MRGWKCTEKGKKGVVEILKSLRKLRCTGSAIFWKLMHKWNTKCCLLE